MASISRDPPIASPVEDSAREGASSSDAAGSSERPADVQQLFEQHNRSLLRFLQARLHSIQEAREVAQEAYVRLLGLDRGSAINFQKTYLFRIATNLANDRLRHRQVERRLDPLVFFDDTEESTAPSPDRQYADRQELQIVLAALESLPPKCLEALLLHRLDGRTFEETAEILNVNPRTVRRLVKRAIEHCAHELDAHARRRRSRST